MKILVVKTAGKLPEGEYSPEALKATGVGLRDVSEMVSRGRAAWRFGELTAGSEADAKSAPGVVTDAQVEVVPRAAAVKKS